MWIAPPPYGVASKEVRVKPPFPLAVAAVLLLGACGDDTGRATSAGPPPRDPIHLVVSGTDREMGLQHGKALAKEIREEVGPRLKARFRAVAKDDADAKFLEASCRTYTGMTKPLLPSEVQDELAGIAEGSGVPEEDILLLEVMRDGLRFHVDAPPLLEAAFASPPGSGDTEEDLSQYIVTAWDGAGGDEASGHALLLERQPVEGSPWLVVTWPGGLGALAGVTRWGFAAQCETPSEKAAMSLHGVPFGIGFARALRAADGPEDLIRRTPPRNGNRVVAMSSGGGHVREVALLASAGPNSHEHVDKNYWVLLPAGPGGADPRAVAMDERLGGYPQRPGEGAGIALAVSGRVSQKATVLMLAPGAIWWHRGVRADGTDVSPPLSFLFPSPK